jgi:tRNA modification GTPase
VSVAETRVAVLTPPGAGAIATVEVSGPRAWELARQLFRPAAKPLPESPELHRFWFGALGEGVGDEVILAVTGEATCEVQCHGGRRVVRWVVEQFVAQGCVESQPTDGRPWAWELLQHAPTLRTASILLDQVHGAFDNAVARVLALLEPCVGHSPTYDDALAALAELARYAHVGRHLVEPWKVVVAGAPNVGKSSLVNAIAGYQRAVVCEVAGTTRDAVRVQVAFDGWPVELTDTAGLRAADGLEAAGVERANRALVDADLVVWVMDGTTDRPLFPDPETEAITNLPLFKWVLVVNKVDQPPGWNYALAHNASLVSATTGEGIPTLITRLAYHLARDVPPAGAVVPFTPRLADLVEAAHASLASGRVDEASRLLRDCRPAG